MRLPSTRQSASRFHDPGPVSTTQKRPAANTATQALARVGCGSGAELPQSATRSASSAKRPSAEVAITRRMIRRKKRSCTAGMRMRSTSATAAAAATPTTREQ